MARQLSILTLIVLALVSGYFIAGLGKVGFDYDFEKFFPEDDPETQYFLDYRKTFGSDNDFVLIGLLNREGIFNEDFLRKVDRLNDSLATARHVKSVQSPTRIKQLTFDPLFGTPVERAWLRFDQPQHYQRDSSRIYQHPPLVGTLFSPHGKALCVFVETDEYISKEAADELAADLSRIMESFTFDELHMAGRATGQAYYVDLLQREFILFISLSILLIIVFLVVAFRSFWGVWVPLLVVMMAVLWTVGILARMDLPLGIMLNVLPVIVFVVGVSDVVHLVTRYFEELRKGKPKMLALKTAYKEVGLATLLTSVTTAIGFLTLLTSNIQPIREFGSYTAMGIVLAFLLAFTLLPAVLSLSSIPEAVNHPTNRNFWDRQLRKLLSKVLLHPKRTFAGCIAVLLISLVGTSLMVSDNYLLEDLRESDPLRQNFYFLEEHFGGVRPFEMSLYVQGDRDVWDLEVLREMDKLSQYLQDDYEVGAQISVLQVVKTLNQGRHNGNPEHYRLPDSQEQLNKLLRNMEQAQRAGMLKALLNEDANRARMAGRIADEGNIAVSNKDAQLAAFFAENINPDLLQYRLTGTSMLIDLNNKSLSTNMIYGLLIAFGVIALIMGVLFRSVKMVIITLIPNMLPLVMIAGIMGFAGIPLKVSTSIIFTIAFGIAVDDTIHFMSKLKLELMKGKSMLYAVKRTFLSTGKAIVVTSIILCGGFITLIGSNFLGTFYIGLLISLMLFFAVLADLLLLPVLLFFFYPREKFAQGSPQTASDAKKLGAVGVG